MLLRFDNTTDVQTVDYANDHVRCSPDVDFDQYVDGNDDLRQDVHFIRLAFELDITEDEDTSTGKNMADIWHDLLTGDTITFDLDPGDSSLPAVTVLPDLTHKVTLLAYVANTVQRGGTFRFLSKSGYEPGDATLRSFTSQLDPL